MNYHEAQIQRLTNALEQIAVLAEYNTTGPDATPRCRSSALSVEQATSLRGSISQIAREALVPPPYRPPMC